MGALKQSIKALEATVHQPLLECLPVIPTSERGSQESSEGSFSHLKLEAPSEGQLLVWQEEMELAHTYLGAKPNGIFLVSSKIIELKGNRASFRN